MAGHCTKQMNALKCVLNVHLRERGSEREERGSRKLLSLRLYERSPCAAYSVALSLDYRCIEAALSSI